MSRMSRLITKLSSSEAKASILDTTDLEFDKIFRFSRKVKGSNNNDYYIGSITNVVLDWFINIDKIFTKYKDYNYIIDTDGTKFLFIKDNKDTTNVVSYDISNLINGKIGNTIVPPKLVNNTKVEIPLNVLCNLI